MFFSLWDALLLLLLIGYFVRGWRRGLAATLIQVFGSLFALFAALAAGDRLAPLFTNRLARPILAEKLGKLGQAAEPIYESAGFFLAFLTAFFVVSLILHLLVRLFRLVQILPVVGTLNSLLGGFAGLLLGVAVLLLFAHFLKLYAPSLFASHGIFSPAVQEKSCLLSYFIQGNPGDFLRFLYHQIQFSST